MNTAEQLATLFHGACRSHGTYSSSTKEASGKVAIKGSAQTIKAPVTLAHWQQHLAGTRPLGVVPVMEDGNCWWGSLDIDLYIGIDRPAMVKRLKAAAIPAQVCRSKSGGAHVFLFFSEPVPAALVVARLRELAAFLGHAGCEIFPKQTVAQPEGRFSSWLNMPYFGGDAGDRCAATETGTEMSVERFLAAAEASRLTVKQLADLTIQHGVVTEFADGPPCLENLVVTGFPAGTRNNGVLALATFAKKKYPDTWREVLQGWAGQYAGGATPFPSDELQSIIKSVGKKNYTYRCNDTPICNVCKIAVCRTRAFGVGKGAGGSPIESLRVLLTEPPNYFVTLRNPPVEVEVTVDVLHDPRAFKKAVMAQHQEWVPEYKHDHWDEYLKAASEKRIEQPASPESGISGAFLELMGQFLTDANGQSRDDLATGGTYHDELAADIWFRLRDLDKHLTEHKFTPPPPGGRAWISGRLSKLGAKPQHVKISGRMTRAWTIKADLFTSAADLETPPTDGSPL